MRIAYSKFIWFVRFFQEALLDFWVIYGYKYIRFNVYAPGGAMFLGNVSLDPLSPYELPVAPSMALKRVAPVVQAVNELAVEMFPGRFPDEERFRTGRVLLKPEESPNEAITLTSLWICALRSKWLIYEVRTKFIGINTRDGRELRHRLVTMSRVVQRCVDGVLVHAMTCPDEYDLCSSLFTTRWEIDPTQLHLRV